jgi:predicted AlkP superfamily pyrophosphatase or phosphodiesterase
MVLDETGDSMRRIAIAFLMLGCAALSARQPEEAAEPHVIVIGVDGLSIDGVVTAGGPALRGLMAGGAWSLEARGVMPTLSSPNWMSMITASGPEQHGITSNGYLKRMQEIVPACQDESGGFPNIFGALRTQRPASRIAIFHDWPGFAKLVERNVPDVMEHQSGPARTTAAAIGYWKRYRPELLFIHLDNVDHAGHHSGWSSPTYYRAVEEADRQIGAILDMLRESGALDSTFVLVTSDHGGKGHNHGKNSLAEIQIPWILAGPGVAAGKIDASVFTYDTGATLAWIFGLQPPACWIGRPVLAAFQPAVVAMHASQVTGNSGCLAAGAQPVPVPVARTAASVVRLRAEGGSQ